MTADPGAPSRIAGQLSDVERELIEDAVRTARPAPRVAIEVGTWLGGGSTLHILRALHANGSGHLWGIEQDPVIYERMAAAICSAFVEEARYFTPVLGRSQDALPRLMRALPAPALVDFAFLDGGDNPLEQIVEFRLLDPHIPVGGQLMAHDAKLRKGRWLRPYLSRMDNWDVRLHDVSSEGLLHARKLGLAPSPASRRRAKLGLFIGRLHPVEIVAALMPPSVNGALLSLLPGRLALRLGQGRMGRRASGGGGA